MMIACKEDLMSCYALPSNKEVYELFMDRCEEFGVNWGSGRAPREHTPNEAVAVGFHGSCYLSYGDNVIGMKGFRELTLSDLKPRTKQYAVLYKGGSYSFHSDKPVGDDIVACFDLSHSEESLSGDFFEEKPRTKVEYVKSDIESRGKALDTFDNDVELFELVDGEYKQVTTESDAISKWRNLYERIETQMTEREAFIEEAMSNFFNKSGVTHEIVAEMFDSGKFKLVN